MSNQDTIGFVTVCRPFETTYGWKESGAARNRTQDSGFSCQCSSHNGNHLLSSPDTDLSIVYIVNVYNRQIAGKNGTPVLLEKHIKLKDSEDYAKEE